MISLKTSTKIIPQKTPKIFEKYQNLSKNDGKKGKKNTTFLYLYSE